MHWGGCSAREKTGFPAFFCQIWKIGRVAFATRERGAVAFFRVSDKKPSANSVPPKNIFCGTCFYFFIMTHAAFVFLLLLKDWLAFFLVPGGSAQQV